ncbi:hypothetical protein S245_015462, partial [Arachis hypogaea]
ENSPSFVCFQPLLVLSPSKCGRGIAKIFWTIALGTDLHARARTRGRGINSNELL